MIIKTTSHRSRDGLERVLGFVPQYHYRFDREGSFVIIEDSLIEKVLKVKGISKCKDQNKGNYRPCWHF